jgi:hypothetical protein
MERFNQPPKFGKFGRDSQYLFWKVATIVSQVSTRPRGNMLCILTEWVVGLLDRSFTTIALVRVRFFFGQD